MIYDQLFPLALQSIGRLHSGETFVVKDLFQGTEWNTLPKGDKLGFGREFKRKVNGGQVPNVSYVRKAANNSAIYRKEAN